MPALGRPYWQGEAWCHTVSPAAGIPVVSSHKSPVAAIAPVEGELESPVERQVWRPRGTGAVLLPGSSLGVWARYRQAEWEGTWGGLLWSRLGPGHDFLHSNQKTLMIKLHLFLYNSSLKMSLRSCRNRHLHEYNISPYFSNKSQFTVNFEENCQRYYLADQCANFVLH